MKFPEQPANETNRLCALYKLDILDTPAEERFDSITAKVKNYFDVSFVLISLVDKDRQWFKSNQGLDANETPRDISFCGHAINYDTILYVPNALEDNRFFDNPLVVNSPFIRFYAGVPLIIAGGNAIGTLCIIDNIPRMLTADDLSMLQEFANMVIAEIEAGQG